MIPCLTDPDPDTYRVPDLVFRIRGSFNVDTLNIICSVTVIFSSSQRWYTHPYIVKIKQETKTKSIISAYNREVKNAPFS